MHKDRLDKLKTFLEENNLDSFIVTHTEGLHYFFGFTGSSGLGLITGGTVFFITDYRYEHRAGREVTADEIIITESGLLECAGNLKDVEKLNRSGFDSSVMTYHEYERAKEILNTDLVPCTDLTSAMSAEKSADEVSDIRSACAITVSVFQSVREFIKEGMTERDLAAEINYMIRKAGGDREAFEPIVLFGERTAMPHGMTGDTNLQNGDLIQLDFGAVLNGYCSDFSRVLFFGEPTRTVREIYLAVREALQKSVDAAVVGAKASDVDAVARDALKRRGFESFFKHSLGHGIGLNIHTVPRLSSKSEAILESGHVFTIEPGVYLPGTGGIRLENSYYLGDSGLENLTEADLDLIILK